MSKSAVIGIDLGAAESYVSFVGKGIVDVVQNEVSKRATPTLCGFTDRERMMGDTALAQIRSNAKSTCRNMKHILGRKVDAPDVEKEHFWSTSKLCSCDDGYAGYAVTYKGEARQMSAVQVTAMYLTKLREVTEKWCQAKVADAVISAPSSYSDVQRQALLDAAKIAGLSVLRIMNEHTATALAYGIYKSNDFDPEKPSIVAFCSCGHSLFSVCLVSYVRGKLTVLSETSDKVGGREMDECLMRAFAAQFEKKYGCDPLSTKKSAYKLEDAVQKCKKILSANAEAPFNVECLMEDNDFASMMKRADLEEMCQPMIDRVKAVLQKAIADSGLTLDQIDSVELVGGGSRVPFVKTLCTEAFGKELCTTMNQEESVARGCALQAAILSPLYKVRDFKVEDYSPFAINVGWMGAAAVGEDGKDGDEDTQMTGGENEYKTATIFPANSMVNVLKMLTFFRSGPFEIKAEYADPSKLLPGTPKELGTFKIEVPASSTPKKVKVKAKLTHHSTFVLESAQLVEEEEFEETVKEKRELPAEEAKPEDAGAAEAPAEKEAWQEGDEKKEGEEKKDAPKEPEKKYEWVDVVKKKKRTKRTDLTITRTGVPGLSEAVIQKFADEETAMQVEMREIIETDEKRNDLEGYIFNMRDKVAEGMELGEFISSADRDKFNTELMTAEDWLYDNPDSTKAQYIEKLDELKVTGDVVQWRFKESNMRAEWITAVQGTITNYRAAVDNPGDRYGHIAADKLSKVSGACSDFEKWLNDLKAKQETLPKHEKPVLICADMEKKNQELAKMADEILKEPKPAPPKPEKQEEPPKEEAPKEEAPKEEAPAGEPNMDVD